ncbi:MAG: hypothetical protein P8K78_06390 [Pirellulales bacterium]|nr:hypothetical protein [Pirellulales bacterium]
MLLSVLLSGCRRTGHDTYAQRVHDLGGTMHVHVDLAGTQITDSDLISLDFPDTLRSISLADSAITDQGARELMRGVNLEQIDLTNTQITDAILDKLKSLPRLCIANVASENVSPQAFGNIRFFLSDRLLDIDQRSSLQPLPRMPQEEEPLDVEGEPLPMPDSLSGYAADIKALDGELQIHLDFHGSEISDSDLVDISLPENIRSISLRGTEITDEGLRELLRARNLEILDLRGTSITDDALPILKLLPRLWKVDVGSTQVSTVGQRELRKMLSQKRHAIPYDRSRSLSRSKRYPGNTQ